MSGIIERNVQTVVFRIFVAGGYQETVNLCRRLCIDKPICVSIQKTDYIYTYGMESGVEVCVINYPRFPSSYEALEKRARELAIDLMDGLCQRSVSIIGPNTTIWFAKGDVDK